MEKLSKSVIELYVLYAALSTGEKKTFESLVADLEGCKPAVVRNVCPSRSSHGEWWQLVVTEAVWMPMHLEEESNE